MNKILIAVLAFIVGGGVVYMVTGSKPTGYQKATDVTPSEVEVVTETAPAADDVDEVAEVEPEPEFVTQSVLGQSVEGRDITAHHFGTGDKELLVVGGIHGGFAWGTSLVAYELIEYLDEDPDVIPEGTKVTVIPVLNPDGVAVVADTQDITKDSEVSATEQQRVAARFNGNDVDLNRNFDCNWQEEGTWRSQAVSGGSKPFSEPEADVVRDYVRDNEVAAAVAYYASAGGVYASVCDGKPLADTLELTALYAEVSGYDAFEEFDSYEVNGDMVNWFAGQGIPAISVLLTDHSQAEWSKNRKGIEAVLKFIAQ